MNDYTYFVYTDPEFRAEVEKLGTKKRPLVEYENLSHKYPISSKLIREYHLSARMVFGKAEVNIKPSYNIDYDYSTDKYFVELPGDVQRITLEELWDHIQLMRNMVFTAITKDGAIIKLRRASLSKSKRKPPENPALLYSLKKARIRGFTWTSIFTMYQDGLLLGYTGSQNQFKSSDKLEQYFNKYCK